MQCNLKFKDATIGPGARRILAARTRVAFRPGRLVVPLDLAPGFEIEGILVGAKDQLPGLAPGRGLPAIMFAANAYGVRWNDGGMTLAPVGTVIKVSVHNLVAHPRAFKCEVIGDEEPFNHIIDRELEEERNRKDGSNMRRKPAREEAIKETSRCIHEVVEDGFRPPLGGSDQHVRHGGAAPGSPQAVPCSLWESLDTRVMMLQARVDDQERKNETEILGGNKTEILAMLADLFDCQISAALIASGCQEFSNATSKEYALGLGFTAVAANSSANINVQPQVVFRPERLVIPASIAEDFLITDIKVGKNSQLVSTGALPAAAFTVRSESTRMMMDTAQISMFVTVSVTNISKEPKNFQGVIFGPSLDPTWSSAPAGRFSARRSW